MVAPAARASGADDASVNAPPRGCRRGTTDTPGGYTTEGCIQVALAPRQPCGGLLALVLGREGDAGDVALLQRDGGAGGEGHLHGGVLQHATDAITDLQDELIGPPGSILDADAGELLRGEGEGAVARLDGELLGEDAATQDVAVAEGDATGLATFSGCARREGYPGRCVCCRIQYGGLPHPGSR